MQFLQNILAASSFDEIFTQDSFPKCLIHLRGMALYPMPSATTFYMPVVNLQRINDKDNQLQKANIFRKNGKVTVALKRRAALKTQVDKGNLLPIQGGGDYAIRSEMGITQKFWVLVYYLRTDFQIFKAAKNQRGTLGNRIFLLKGVNEGSWRGSGDFQNPTPLF